MRQEFLQSALSLGKPIQVLLYKSCRCFGHICLARNVKRPEEGIPLDPEVILIICEAGMGVDHVHIFCITPAISSSSLAIAEFVSWPENLLGDTIEKWFACFWNCCSR